MMRSPLGNRRSRPSGALAPIVVFLVALLVVGTPMRGPFRTLAVGVASPFWSLGTSVATFAQRVFPTFFQNAKLLDENAALKAEISSLRLEYWRAQVIEEERDHLREFLGRASSTDDLLLAAVLAAPNLAPYDTLLLDVGQDAGIVPGAAVMTDGGFVIGVIRDVLPTRSVAELYSSPGQSEDVVVGPSRIPAVAHGIGGGNYRIELPKNTDITEGSTVGFAGKTDRFLGLVERLQVDEKTGITTLFLRLPVNVTELPSVIVDLTPEL